MSNLSIAVHNSDTITSYHYNFTDRGTLGTAPIKRVVETQTFIIEHNKFLNGHIKYVTPEDRANIKKRFPHDSTLQTYLEACSLAIPQQLLPQDLPTDIKNSHEYNICKAFDTLKSLADEERDPASIITLAIIHSEGALGRAIDEALSFTYFKQAADSGHAAAQNILFAVYHKGLLKQKQNPAKAFEYLQLAAKQGHAEAQYNMYLVYKYDLLKQGQHEGLGFCYLQKAAEQNYEKAVTLYNQLNARPPQETIIHSPVAPAKTPEKERSSPKRKEPTKTPAGTRRPVALTNSASPNRQTPPIILEPMSENMHESLLTQVNNIKTDNALLKNDNAELKKSLTNIRSLIKQNETHINTLFAILAQRQSTLAEPCLIELPTAIELEQDNETSSASKRAHETSSDSAPKRQKSDA